MADDKDRIIWVDPYAKKRPEELQTFATCIVDGQGYRISNTGRTYCVGPVTVDGNQRSHVVGKEVTDIVTDAPQTKRPRIAEGGPKIIMGKTTTPRKVNTFGPPQGRPKKQTPDEKIKELAGQGRSPREIAKLTRIPRSTVQRIINGQRVLV